MIGVDLIRLKRLKNLLSDSFIKKVFTKNERDYINSKSDKLPHYATTFAAKEAVFKALGTGLGEPGEVEIIRLKTGKPVVKLKGESKKLSRGREVFVNMSFDTDYAIAVAFLK